MHTGDDHNAPGISPAPARDEVRVRAGAREERDAGKAGMAFTRKSVV